MPRPRRVAADTLRRFVPTPLARALSSSSIRYVRSVFAEEYESLSYVVDWRDAFVASDEIDSVTCNVNDVVALAAVSRHITEFDLIVALHSAAGDSLMQVERSRSALSRRRGRLLVFFGNEYDDMAAKRALLRDVAAEYVGSQLPIEAARWLYEGCGSTVLAAPAALNPIVYRPGPADRSVDIGFRGDRYASALIGDDERARIIEYFEHDGPARGLRVDIAFIRLPRREWSRLLARSVGTIGAEAGTYYLERDDTTRDRAARYIAAHPRAPLLEVLERCYPPRPARMSGKAISSRHLEAVGTKTCQLLVRGSYNGILHAGEHYIAVTPDLGNIEDAIRRFGDGAERRRIVESAYEMAMDAHTYAQRVRSILAVVLAGHGSSARAG